MRTSLALCVPLAELPARAAACAVLFSLVGTVACTHSDPAAPCADADTRNGVDCQTLYIPPVLTGPDYDLTLAESSVEWSEGVTTPTYAYNGQPFWGPTLRMHKGDDVRVNVTNELMDETTAHWHGFHIPAAMDGGPHQPIASGSTWSPEFTVMNDAGMYWYHPHMHMMTAMQLAMGAGGLIYVDDDAEAALALPRTYGVDDVPLVLTSRRLDDDGAIDATAIYGDAMVTNGTMNAEATLPAQFVRLRILNAEIERSYNLGFSDDRTFWVIGTDGGLLEAPVPVTRLPMATGERNEILVDLSGDAPDDTLALQAYNEGQDFGFPGGEPDQSGEFGSLLNNTTFSVLRIRVTAATDDAISTLPATLVARDYWTAADATVERTLNITDDGPGTPFSFDDTPYDESVINQHVALDATEQWTIQNNRTFGHAFHIHDVQFHIVSRSSGTVPDYEQGWKDTVFLPINESVSFVARFSDFASATDPYMYHCHMANHEDGGLMGQFVVE
jgi:blue copper oxidase